MAPLEKKKKKGKQFLCSLPSPQIIGKVSGMKAFSVLVCQMHGTTEEERLNRTTLAVARDYLHTIGKA